MQCDTCIFYKVCINRTIDGAVVPIKPRDKECHYVPIDYRAEIDFTNPVDK